MKASSKWGKAQELVQRHLDSGKIKPTKGDDDRSLGMISYKVLDPENILSNFPDAYFFNNYGDPHGANYKKGIILFPGKHEGEIDVAAQV